jgi:hypothetical protein
MDARDAAVDNFDPPRAFVARSNGLLVSEN